MDTIKGIFGIKTSAQKAQEAAQKQALQIQQRQANAVMEDGAVQRAQAAPGRQLAGMGRRTLAFMGSELGVSDSLSGGNA